MVVTCSTRVISWSKTTPMFLAELTGIIRSLVTWMASISGRGRWLAFRISSSVFPLFTFSLFRTNQESTWLTHASIRAKDDCCSAVMGLKLKQSKVGCRRRIGKTRVHDVLQYSSKERCTTSTGRRKDWLLHDLMICIINTFSGALVLAPISYSWWPLGRQGPSNPFPPFE